MNYSYDEELKKIDFFKVHPNLLPFIGDEYEKYKILHVGESHYLSQTSIDDVNSVQLYDFIEWESSACEKALESSPGYVDTRIVLTSFLGGYNGKGYNIFRNFIKSFDKIFFEKSDRLTLEMKKDYKYLAFMNFFQMPSLIYGAYYWDSLLASAKFLGDKQLAYKIWDDCVKYSTAVLDKVIEIIKPKLVVITSIYAGQAYTKSNDIIIRTSHPNTPYSWRKPLKSLNYMKGIDVFENALIEYKKSL